MVVSKPRSPVRVFYIIGFGLSLMLTLWLFYQALSDSSYIWFAIGSLLCIVIPLSVSSRIHSILATETEIQFISKSFLKSKTLTFSYSDITNFKSYLLNRSLGEMITTETYGVFDLEFKDGVTYQIDELSYSNFQELKHFIFSKIKS